ncbi:MAG: SurA N-terminal domain-containing protein [Gammaproteobacteria bacterium]
MLQAINDKAKGILGWIIIALISIPFALWGIQEYIGGGQEQYVASVNGTQISVREFDQALVRHKQRLESMFGGQLPQGEAFERQMKQQVVDQLISRQILEQLAESSGFRVSDKSLAEKIQAMDVFQQDGQFQAKSYEQLLSSQGMSVAGFEFMMRKDIVIQQLQQGIVNSSIVGKNYLDRIDRLQQQMRKVSYLSFKNNDYLKNLSVSEEDIQQYYENNQSRYMHPEQLSVSYVEFKGDMISVDVPVEEENLRRQYDEYIASLAEREQRKARHILIQLDETADEQTKTTKKQQIEDLLQKIKAGEDFAKLASTASEDPGSSTQGGDLGWVSRGMMVPAFDDALFALNKGEVSEVVESGFGYHLIKLEDIKAETPVSFEKQKAELVKELKQQEIDNQFYERSETMATLAYENDDTLQIVAEALGLEIKHSDLFTRFAGQGIAKDKKVRDAAFNPAVLKDARNSDVIELEKNHILVLRIDEHKPSKPKILEEVRQQVEVALKSEKSAELARQAAETSLSELMQGKTLKELSNKYSQQSDLGEIKRDDKKSDQRIVQAAFKLPRPGEKPEYEMVDLGDGSAVLILEKVTEVSTPSKKQQLEALEKQIETMVSNQEFAAVLDYLKSQSDIVISDQLMQ